MSREPALSVSGIRIAFGGVVAVDSVGFDAELGEILSIIGPNGAGKTTLFNVISGLYRPQGGTIRLNGKDVSGAKPHQLAQFGMSRTFQNLQIFFHLSALENVMVGCSRWEATSLVADLLHLRSVRRQNGRSRSAALSLLSDFGIDRYAEVAAGELPYGVMKRLEMARAMASRPSVLLLDEPAAGCGETETEEIIEIVKRIALGGVAVVLIEHDMKMVMGISDRVLVLNQGQLLAEGRPEMVRENPKVIEAYLGQRAAAETVCA
jgi:branched-chain amino acid transport system ATP-binding protein